MKAEDPLERWIEGSLCRYTNIYDETVTRIMSPSGHMNDVRPETVGQFTGLKDKDGKESYFGDIVRFTPTVPNRFGSEYVDADYKLLAVIEADRYGHSVLRVLYGKGGFNKGDVCHIEGLSKGEVVGNIFDTPEFLKGGEE